MTPTCGARVAVASSRPNGGVRVVRRTRSARWWMALVAVGLALTACERPQRPQPAGPGVTAEAKAATLEQVPKQIGRAHV